MHADRVNRVALTLFGLILLAAGGAGLAASTGAFGAALSRHTLLANPAGRYIGHHGGWLWPAIAGGCLLLALACLRWIWALLASTDRAGDITIPGDTAQGTTILQPAALTDALTREISAYHGGGGSSATAVTRGSSSSSPPPPPPTCTPCTTGSKPKPSLTPARPSASPHCPSSSTSSEPRPTRAHPETSARLLTNEDRGRAAGSSRRPGLAGGASGRGRGGWPG